MTEVRRESYKALKMYYTGKERRVFGAKSLSDCCLAVTEQLRRRYKYLSTVFNCLFCQMMNVRLEYYKCATSNTLCQLQVLRLHVHYQPYGLQHTSERSFSICVWGCIALFFDPTGIECTLF